MFFNNRKKKLKKEFKLSDNLFFSKGEIEIYVEYDVIIDQVEKSPKEFDNYSLASFFYLLLDAQLSAIFQNKQAVNILLNNYQKLISKGIFDIWNNELFYHQQNYIAKKDLISYFLDDFQKKHPVFSNLNLGDVKHYLNKTLEMDQIKVLEFKEDYFKQNNRIDNIYKTVEFLEDLAFYFYDKNVEVSEYFKSYNFNISFEENLGQAIYNYDEFKTEMKLKPITVFKNHEKIDKESLYIGKYIDFRSLYSEALFVTIPKYKDDYIISVSKFNEDDTAKELIFSIYDIKNNNYASESVYQEILDLLKKP